ncbi:cytochrome ubiquinol oxidase subunit I [Micromonospora terminaliae]|uniref:Cytochrome ubiquinol oxidase subunit I n=1 Tax=Micromonospora terminaliae TaxID=1914461 RepID=A0AAJ3DJ45_9ACTN|nr:cytochrome ubiquinol oxidase subunit I [Micromonospora terminaliae]NES27903.1 cytochrome ubiquinol oxidase subunit I [Micromonospora terminaliae]QGL47325.1 cytochrome ubiquinol oxidase subunit I [Micromonospora terminaliae]
MPGLSLVTVGASLVPADPAQLLPAREQMAFTLGFHIILVPFGVAFTFLMLIANARGIRRNDETALLLARRWSQVAAVLFAVGAVSGTVLSFELGLLWPRLMGTYGAAFGIPFAIEGLFFFLEAIFVAIYVFGWQRMRPWPHFWTGVPVVLSGIGGTLSVVAANAWMNQPGGFTMRDGEIVEVRPLEVIFNGAFGFEAVHMLLAAYMVAGFVVAGVYAAGMLRGRRDRYHRLGLAIPLTVAALVTPLQIFVGDIAAREVYRNEPAKFAAIEAVPTTGTHVPEVLGGYYANGKVHGGIEIPSGASLLSGYSPSTRIQGLDAIPAEVRPPDRLVAIVHLSFDTMVGIGTALLGLSAWYALAWWRRRDLPRSRWFLRATTVSGVLAVVALEAGWVVTEVGRQPWTVTGHLLTRDAVTTSGNLWLFFAATLALYVAVGATTVYVLRLLRRRWRDQGGAAETDVPYGPARGPEATPAAGQP